MFLETQALLVEQGFRHIEHGVVGAPDGRLGVTAGELPLCCGNRALGFGEELLRGRLHAGTASSRTFARNGVSWLRQSRSRKNTLLMLTPYRSERAAVSALVWSTSAP